MCRECSLEASKEIVEQAKLFKVTVSFGNVTSQMSLPCFMSHASIPAAVRAARGLPDDLIRISAGIEDAADLIQGRPSIMTCSGGILFRRRVVLALGREHCSQCRGIGPHCEELPCTFYHVHEQLQQIESLTE